MEFSVVNGLEEANGIHWVGVFPILPFCFLSSSLNGVPGVLPSSRWSCLWVLLFGMGGYLYEYGTVCLRRPWCGWLVLLFCLLARFLLCGTYIFLRDE